MLVEAEIRASRQMLWALQKAWYLQAQGTVSSHSHIVGVRQGKPRMYHTGDRIGMDDDRSNQTKGAGRNIAVACDSSHARDQWVKHCVKVAQVHTDQWVEHCLAVAQKAETTWQINDGRTTMNKVAIFNILLR